MSIIDIDSVAKDKLSNLLVYLEGSKVLAESALLQYLFFTNVSKSIVVLLNVKDGQWQDSKLTAAYPNLAKLLKNVSSSDIFAVAKKSSTSNTSGSVKSAKKAAPENNATVIPLPPVTKPTLTPFDWTATGLVTLSYDFLTVLLFINH